MKKKIKDTGNKVKMFFQNLPNNTKNFFKQLPTKTKKFIKHLPHNTKIFIKNFPRNAKTFIKNNVLFSFFVASMVINGILLRAFTVKNFTDISPILSDLALVLIVASFAYLFKPKNRFKYLMTWMIILTAVCLINSMYYANYVSFASFSLLATSLQIFGVGDALENVTEIFNFNNIF